MKLTKILKPDNILWQLKAGDRDGALREISSRLKEVGTISDENDVYEKLKAREEILSTGIGNGLAIPHCKTDQIEDVHVALAKSDRGVNFFSVDQQPVYLLFIVLSPPDKPNPHLNVLARISKLLRAPGAVGNFKSAGSPEELYGMLEREEKKVL